MNTTASDGNSSVSARSRDGVAMLALLLGRRRWRFDDGDVAYVKFEYPQPARLQRRRRGGLGRLHLPAELVHTVKQRPRVGVGKLRPQRHADNTRLALVMIDRLDENILGSSACE